MERNWKESEFDTTTGGVGHYGRGNLSHSGSVKNRENQPVSGLRIEAWDKDLFFDDFVAEATTDPGGRFHMEISEDRFKELFLDRRPDFYFRRRGKGTGKLYA